MFEQLRRYEPPKEELAEATPQQRIAGMREQRLTEEPRPELQDLRAGLAQLLYDNFGQEFLDKAPYFSIIFGTPNNLDALLQRDVSAIRVRELPPPILAIDPVDPRKQQS